MNKRDSESISLPSCLVGQAPERHFKRQMVERFGVESNIECDEHKIQMRLKQIGFGKNTLGYDQYIKEVPKNKRKGYAEHPRTPDPYEKASKREFEGKVKAWRRALHRWDPDTTAEEEAENKESGGDDISPEIGKNMPDRVEISVESCASPDANADIIGVPIAAFEADDEVDDDDVL